MYKKLYIIILKVTLGNHEKLTLKSERELKIDDTDVMYTKIYLILLNFTRCNFQISF